MTNKVTAPMPTDWKKLFQQAMTRLEGNPSPLLAAAMSAQKAGAQYPASSGTAGQIAQLGAMAGTISAATGIGSITTGTTTAVPYGIAGMGGASSGSGGQVNIQGGIGGSATGTYPSAPSPDWNRMFAEQEKQERRRIAADRERDKTRTRLSCAAGMLPVLLAKGLSEEDAIAKAMHLATKLVDANERVNNITDMLMEGEKERSEGDAQEAKQA
jgi:hypothetical protein